MAVVALPDGTHVDIPDDMPKEQVRAALATKFPELAQKKNEDSTPVKMAKGFKEGVKQGATFGYNDELQAAIAAGTVGLHNVVTGDKDLPMGEAYDQALTDFRNQSKDAKANAPGSFLTGEVAGSLLPGAKLPIPQGAPGGTALQGAISGGARGLAGGLASGALYGFGTGEGGASSRLGNAALVGAMGGGLGGAAGSASGALANSLAARAAKLLEIKRSRMSPPSMSGDGGQAAPVSAQSTAIQKVVDKLKQDYPNPDDFNKVVGALMSGKITLAELGGEKTQDLALGAAQYPSGKGVINEFFNGKPPEPGAPAQGGAIDAARQNVTSSIEKNISGNQDYLGTLDEIVAKGRKKAAPLYEKANDQLVESEVAKTPEMQAAIQSAKAKFPTELQGLPDNSVKVLDYAKRVLDDQINTAQRAGEGNFARSRTEIKNALLQEMDKASPDYQAARATAGDYLSHKAAMEAGRSFKGNAKQIARDYGKLSDTEQEAYRVGVVDKVREMADSVRDNGNAYTKIFGTPETRAKLKAILPEDQFKQLSDDLWASDRIYGLRNKILGNSTTASKQISAQEFAADETAQSLARGDVKGIATKPLITWIVKKFDGISDKDAGEVARILTAKDSSEKLRIIRQISDRIDPKGAAKSLGGDGKQLQTYFAIQDAIKPYRNALSGSAASIASQPLQITVPIPKDPNEGNK